ncbi:alpha-galactosidase [Arthrobacter cavernae]|uniref:alpha-galactosidase n=1 Tax=Arthrobacter cavernae TaxID=2817681 RepID=A0A939HF79_9MICC|nr:alpha-galactosidase [Arthrobacter cavernae]MBO1269769.1 alpha-galactosidase [Arthrobacter cavernae]
MDPLHLRSAGTSLLLAFYTGEAQIVHWGADLGDALPDLSLFSAPVPHSALDVPIVAGLLPQASSGWPGRPGLRGHRTDAGVPGFDFSSALRIVSAELDGGDAAVVLQADPDTGVEVRTSLRLGPSGLLEIRHTLTNTGTTPYVLDELGLVLPVPGDAVELLDLTGRWCRENHPQRHQIAQGTWVRSGRHGRTGHDSSLLVAAGTAGFSNRSGRVWAVHFGWSGNHEQYLDSLADGRRMLGASELLGSGEVVLAPGAEYSTPVLYSAYSDHGLDGVTERFYEWFRARPQHVATQGAAGGSGKARPVVLNTWEAVYFDHRIEPLIELAESAAELGVERFVLDDGWFRGRRDDTAGLGDWYVDEGLWPEGLTPLIDAVTSRGMEFGLWVEPEMINLDSDVARAHPDWIVGPAAASHKDGGRLPLEWRNQYIIDLANPQAWQYIYDRIDALLRENNISYLKWDQNRDLTEHGHGGRPSVHEQTLAAYRLFDALKASHPQVEIESCSSGGARVDLGILQRTDRVWASDCNDALERQTIQRWTQAVLPPELVGAHVGPTHAHTTGRTHSITFRAITALFGHFGMEWDIRKASGHERAVLLRIIAIYKEHRGLLHSGVRVNADLGEPNLRLHGVVSQDGSEALFAAVVLASLAAEMPGNAGIPGLDPDRTYRVEAIMPTSEDLPVTVEGDAYSPFVQITPPAWLDGGLTATGRFLAEVGLPLPVLRPEHALLLKVTAV